MKYLRMYVDTSTYELHIDLTYLPTYTPMHDEPNLQDSSEQNFYQNFRLTQRRSFSSR